MGLESGNDIHVVEVSTLNYCEAMTKSDKTDRLALVCSTCGENFVGSANAYEYDAAFEYDE